MKSIEIMGKSFPIQQGGRIGVWESHKFIMFGGKSLITEYSRSNEIHPVDNSYIWERIVGWLPGATIDDVEEAFSLNGDGLPVEFICQRFNLPINIARTWLNEDRVRGIWLNGAEAFKPEIKQLRAQSAQILHNDHFVYVYYDIYATIVGTQYTFKVGEWGVYNGKSYKLTKGGYFEVIE